ncbi:hypothetical protein EWM64_g1409 [Hericium alpestre]|uniref:Uncharacterized protein n=1 Tax=Hericium alpestre TaxID=135208 RepID=A0A4Z0A779_9AGAM|nr:hypothetical protein EWM64_g1409 [Hericium alpestre]
MATDILDPAALIALLPTLLPITRKRLETPQDAIAALLHTVLTALSFRVIAVDDSSPASSILNGVLPEDWNRHGPGNYTFRYRHEQSSLEFVVKLAKLGSRTLINAIAVETDKAASLDISTNDFTSPSFFPYDANAENAQPLIHGFISSSRVADLISQFKLTIVQKLMPGLQKEGYTESTEVPVHVHLPRPGPSEPPARPTRPESPPYAPERPFRLPTYPATYPPPRNPLEIGRSDLEPLGGFAPPPLFPGATPNGMFVGPDHPIFGRGQGANGGQPNRGPWGGDGYLPPMGAPPGARFDPVGPGLGPFPGRTGTGPRGGQPPARGGNVQDPDNDEFPPPGSGDMFM